MHCPLLLDEGIDKLIAWLERDFTYIDDIVPGCVGAVDRVTPSTKKRRSVMSSIWAIGAL